MPYLQKQTIMSRTFKLSKSRLLSYRQCPKRLWLQTHSPELAEVSESTAAIMSAGTSAGEVFHSLYPEGILVDCEDLGEALRLTQRLLEEHPKAPIFEATFEAGDVLVRLDMLAPSEDGFRLVEVKSSTRVKDYHLDDAAIQTWVARQAGIPVSETCVAHINNQFVYPGDQNYQGLFVEQQVNAEVAERQEQIIHWVRDAQTMLANPEPCIAPGEQCTLPFACPFLCYCDPATEAPEYPVEMLPYGGKLIAELKEAGFNDLRDVPEERLSKEKHLRILRATKSGTPELAQEGRDIARHLPYPRFYLDFETIAFAVPQWANSRPYQQIPFQFSCHVEPAPGFSMPSAFLSTTNEDPRRPFAEALIAALKPKFLEEFELDSLPPGPVLVYNASFERTRVKELAAHFPDLAEDLLAINERMVDLLPIARNHYYHPEMKGSWSIKAVLPTIGSGLDYEGMAVANGGMAQEAFSEMISPETSPERKEELRQGLLDYCALDTYALLQLVGHFSKGQ